MTTTNGRPWVAHMEVNPPGMLVYGAPCGARLPALQAPQMSKSSNTWLPQRSPAHASHRWFGPSQSLCPKPYAPLGNAHASYLWIGTPSHRTLSQA